MFRIRNSKLCVSHVYVNTTVWYVVRDRDGDEDGDEDSEDGEDATSSFRPSDQAQTTVRVRVRGAWCVVRGG